MKTVMVEAGRLTIRLDGIEPPIRRVVDIPLDITLRDLHAIIQAAMGWTDSHLFQFVIGQTMYGIPDPDWDLPEMPMHDAAKARLPDILAERPRRIVYIYDFGDDWTHDIAVKPLGAADPEARYPRLVEGVGRCPPEDVGGVTGFFDFVEAITNPAARDHREMLEWYGGPFDPADIGEAEIEKALGKLATRFARRKPRTATPRRR